MNPWITAADLFTLIAGFVLLPHGEHTEIRAATVAQRSEQRLPLDLIDAQPENSSNDDGQREQRLSISVDGRLDLDGQVYPNVVAACAAIDGGVVVLAVDEQAPFHVAGAAMQALAGRARVVLATEHEGGGK